MNHILGGSLLIVCGLLSMIFHRAVGGWARELQSRLTRREYGATGFQIGYVLGGVAAVLVGVLMLSGKL
jgi:hypothetical protein